LADSLGLLDDKRKDLFKTKKQDIERFTEKIKSTRITPNMAAEIGAKCGLSEADSAIVSPISAYDFLKRPGVKLEHLFGVVTGLSDIAADAALTLEIEIKYSGYLNRQETELRRLFQRENLELPDNLDFQKVPGLSNEAVECLRQKKPRTLGQAGRIPGVTPASVSAILIYVTKLSRYGLDSTVGN
jgi:tRNA uridine 5-carboxymethylaminomethyl modification enzyme